MVIKRDECAVISSVFPFLKYQQTRFVHDAFIFILSKEMLWILMLIRVYNARAFQPPCLFTEGRFSLWKRNELQKYDVAFPFVYSVTYC